jgi:hypothetical protein
MRPSVRFVEVLGLARIGRLEIDNPAARPHKVNKPDQLRQTRQLRLDRGGRV